MTATFTNAWISFLDNLIYRNVGTLPLASKYYLCASQSTTLTRASNLADFINAELQPQFGYNRSQILWTANGAYSNTNQRDELPSINAGWTANGGSLQFQTVFLLANAHSKASEAFSPSNISGSTITITGNLLSNGDSVIPVANAGSALPTGLTSGVSYTVLNVSAGGAFQLSSDGQNPITLTDAGSGTFQLRYATGIVVVLQVETNPLSAQPGVPVQYEIDIVGMNANYGPGV